MRSSRPFLPLAPLPILINTTDQWPAADIDDYVPSAAYSREACQEGSGPLHLLITVVHCWNWWLNNAVLQKIGGNSQAEIPYRQPQSFAANCTSWSIKCKPNKMVSSQFCFCFVIANDGTKIKLLTAKCVHVILTKKRKYLILNIEWTF